LITAALRYARRAIFAAYAVSPPLDATPPHIFNISFFFTLFDASCQRWLLQAGSNISFHFMFQPPPVFAFH
jgi:hypothetical protein